MKILRKLFGPNLESQLASLPEKITTAEQVQVVGQLAKVLRDKGDFLKAITLYNRLLIESLLHLRSIHMK